MPCSVKKVGSEFCVFMEDGKQSTCYKSKKEAEAHKNTMNEKQVALENTTLENGPVITGVAVTNIPHLPLPAISVIDGEGKRMVRVPFLRAGIFRHPNGDLIFNDKVFDKMLENNKIGKPHYGVSLNERHKQAAALAWFDEKRGGYIAKETDPDFGTLLVGYGIPTSERVVEMIQNGEYVYASAEFQPNHRDTMIAKLSMDDMEEITLEELLEERTMEDVTISLEQLQAEIQGKDEKIVNLEATLKETNDKLVELEKQLAKPEVKPELPVDVRIMLEDQAKEIQRLKKNALETQVSLVIAKAESYRDSNGNGHSPVLLEIARSAMLGEPIAQGDETIKLESGKPADVADYFRKVFVHVLNNVPGQVSFTGKTESDDERQVSLERGTGFVESDYKSFWVENL